MDALLVIDMQRWMFRTTDRQLQLPLLTPNIMRAIDVFDRSGKPIIDVRTEHKADRSSWSRSMLRENYACLIEGTFEASYVEGCELPEAAQTVIKTRNNAFLRTDLDTVLRQLGVQSLVLAGVFVDGCVGLTAADAAQRDYAVRLAAGAVGHISPATAQTIQLWLYREYGISEVEVAGG